MHDWDDYRIFLAIFKAGGLKIAARSLGMHHSSCARRLNSLEAQLGVRLFDRLPGGYSATDAGEKLARSMQIIRDEFDGIERDLSGKDRSLEGPLKLSLTHGFALHLLMPHIQDFMERFPDINLELNMTYKFTDLASREADVAIRLADDPPLSLTGPRVGSVNWCAYAHADYLDTHDLKGAPQECHWIGWGQAAKHLNWPGKKLFPNIPARGVIASEVLQLSAAEQKVGIASLPCYLADGRPDVKRLPGVEPEPHEWIWILSHRDMAKNARVAALTDHLAGALTELAPRLEGRAAGPD